MRQQLRAPAGALRLPLRALPQSVLTTYRQYVRYHVGHASQRPETAPADDPSWPQPAEAATEVEADSSPSTLRLWLQCIKPPMYTVAVTPMVLGAVLAYYVTGVFNGAACTNLTVGGILVIAWLNLSNDAFDAVTGVDSKQRKPESIINLTGAPWLVVLAIAFALLAWGGSKLYATLSAADSPASIALLAGAIICGYVYQGPPFRLSYKGLGEPLCLLAFSVLSTVPAFVAIMRAAGSDLSAANLFAAHWPLLLPVSLVGGLTTTAILFCSHFHQGAGDRAAGKMSPIVRMGTTRACQVLQVGSLLTHALAFAALFADAGTQASAALTLLPAVAAVQMNSFAAKNHEVPADVKPLKVYAIRWHTALTLALFLALFTAGVHLHGAESLN
eukprot:jgi/Ulvmu1/3872/UM018_0091.1